jgi:hypothetical protein
VLAGECRQLATEVTQTRAKALASLEKLGVSPLVDIHIKSDELQLLSTMTLIYRAVPAPEGSPSRFCDECLGTARRAMEMHLACVELIKHDAYAKATYFHWYDLIDLHIHPVSAVANLEK